MTPQSYMSIKLPEWAGKLLRAIFLMALGFLAHQFWLLPTEQQHQNDRLDKLEETMKSTNDQVKTNTDRLTRLEVDHVAMMRVQTKIERKIDDQTDLIQAHDRRARKKAQAAPDSLLAPKQETQNPQLAGTTK